MSDDIDSAFLEPAPEKSPHSKKSAPTAWLPKLGPIGQQVLRDRRSKMKLLYGERGSTKSNILLHDLVVHCYQDLQPPQEGKIHIPPLALICVIVRSAATEGGVWEKLHTLVRKEWYDGIGLEITEPRMDDQKNRYCFIANKYGGWSRVVLRSIPYGSNIQQRLKGTEPSLFFFDEITEADSPDYFLKPLQQLRRPTGSHRQFTAACNPSDEGEDHWVWKVMVQHPVKLMGNEDGVPEIPEGGGKLGRLHPDYSVYHVPLKENIHWTEAEKANYTNTLMAEAATDPTAVDRLIKGLWTPRPVGEGLFANFYIPKTHTLGDAVKRVGLLPIAGHPMLIGYDLGQRFSSVTFEQLVPFKTEDGIIFKLLVFDEVDYMGKRILYKTLAQEVIERIQYWRKRLDYPFQVRHVTDDSAVNQWRPDSGSYDAWEFEKAYLEAGEGEKAKLVGCPKGEGSVGARVRWLQNALYQDHIVTSAMCHATNDMLLKLTADPKKPDNPRRCVHLHKFDSLTYPPFEAAMRGFGTVLRTGKTIPHLTRAGLG